jgi:hypothetical protein
VKELPESLLEQLRHPPVDAVKLSQWIAGMTAELMLHLPPEEIVVLLQQTLWTRPECHEEIRNAIRRSIQSNPPDPPAAASGSAKAARTPQTNDRRKVAGPSSDGQWQKWQVYLATLPWENGQLDDTDYAAFRRAASLNIPPRLAFDEVAARTKAIASNWRPGKLSSQLRRAYAYVSAHLADVPKEYQSKGPKPKYESEKLSAVACKLNETVDDEYLRLRSKFTPWNRSPAGFLHKLYKPGENILVFSDYFSQGESLWIHPGLSGDLSVLNQFQSGHQNVWFLIQPVDGEVHWNPRELSESRRSEESVTAWRYMLLESDEAPVQEWLKALVRLPLPISSVATSGKRSIHSLIRLDAACKAQWDRIVRRELFAPLKILGADESATHGVQLSRLPGCMRRETGQLQKLLYLDDEPDEIPICEKPRRDPDALRTSPLPIQNYEE